MEYLIGPKDGESFLVLDKAAVVTVLVPRGWPAEQADGAGDFRYHIEGTDVAFSLGDDGWRVLFDGPMPPDRAEQLVEIVADQVAEATGERTKWQAWD
jgi:hypothetical protein